MATTKVADVADQVQTIWSPLFMQELREDLLLGALVNKDYQGEIRKRNDTVTVSQIVAPVSQLRTVGIDADSFESNKLETLKVDIKADKRAVSSYEFEDLVDLQSIIDTGGADVRQALMHDVARQINDHLYSLVAPSAATPDHVLNSITALDTAQMKALRLLASQAKWLKDKGWWLLADPSYYGDVLSDLTLASSDFGATDAPLIGGQLSQQRFGFNILEDNSRSVDTGIAFHPDFLHLVMQTDAQFKISDQHSNKKFGFVMSVDLVFGAKQGIAGDEKVISFTAA